MWKGRMSSVAIMKQFLALFTLGQHDLLVESLIASPRRSKRTDSPTDANSEKCRGRHVLFNLRSNRRLPVLIDNCYPVKILTSVE